MKNVSFFDDSKVEKAPFEIEVSFQKNSEFFFERVIKNNLKEAVIYSDESIAFIDKFIKSKVKNADRNTKLQYSFLIGSYLGQYVIFNFQGNWVIDQAKDFKSVMNCFVRYTKEYDLYSRPFACSISRIYWGNNESIMSEIEIIKELIDKDMNWAKNLNRKPFESINTSIKKDVL
jgi:hypothetical protein